MKYEVQKRSKTEPAVWYMVAQTNVKMWAEIIAGALNICEPGDFRATETGI